MVYPINSISVADLQSLYECRILRQPSAFLPAIYRDSKPEVLNFSSGRLTTEVDAYNRKIYAFSANTTPGTKTVPLLEFTTPPGHSVMLQDLISLEVAGTHLILRTSLSELPEGFIVRCYWTYTYKDVREALDQVNQEITQLKTGVDKLIQRLSTITVGNGLDDLKGKDNHLVQLTKLGESLTLGDSQHIIKEYTTNQTHLLNPSQTELSRLGKSIKGTLELALTDARDWTVQEFRNGIIEIRGTGDLYLINNTSKVVLQGFIGNVYADNCADIELDDGAKLTEFAVINSTVYMANGYVERLGIYRHSVYHHANGTVRELKYIGIACRYHSEIIPSVTELREPEPMRVRSRIPGLYTNKSGLILCNGLELSFVTGQHDDPIPPSETRYTGQTIIIPPEGEGTDPIPDVTGGMNIPQTHYDICNEDYRTLAFSQAFMTTSSGPQTVKDITTETFHTLRACMNWCCGEFGGNIYGNSYGKLIRTWCMYQQDTAYRGDGKTLKDFILRLRTQVLSWGGRDIWTRSFEDLKASTGISDEYALTFIQDLYNNIRYPQLFGVTSTSDSDVIKAMSGMPTMNETTYVGTGAIPDRNKPLVWFVSKEVPSIYPGYYYVLYRPKAFDSSIAKGVNPAVK